MGSQNKKATLVQFSVALSFFVSLFMGNICLGDHQNSGHLEVCFSESENISNQKIDLPNQALDPKFLNSNDTFPQSYSLHSSHTIFHSHYSYRLTSITTYCIPPPAALPS